MDDHLTKGPQAVIYLTGAPGTGKSTLVRALQAHFSNVEVFSYGSRMANHLAESKENAAPDEFRLRGGTDPSVTRADIIKVDRNLVKWVKQRQVGRLLLIDTHQVTLEATGLRFVPFEKSVLAALSLSMIWLLSASAETVAKRIAANAMGRIIPTVHEAEIHAAVQNTVAAEYAIQKGVELRVLDAERTGCDVFTQAIDCLGRIAEG